jgi:hypothetical protein
VGQYGCLGRLVASSSPAAPRRVSTRAAFARSRRHPSCCAEILSPEPCVVLRNPGQKRS